MWVVGHNELKGREFLTFGGGTKNRILFQSSAPQAKRKANMARTHSAVQVMLMVTGGKCGPTPNKDHERNGKRQPQLLIAVCVSHVWLVTTNLTWRFLVGFVLQGILWASTQVRERRA